MEAEQSCTRSVSRRSATRLARIRWKKQKLPCLSEVVAESMWRTMGWVWRCWRVWSVIHQMERQMKMAQSWMCLGQIGVCQWRYLVVPKQNNWETFEKLTEKQEKNQGTMARLTKKKWRYHGADVWRQQDRRKMEALLWGCWHLREEVNPINHFRWVHTNGSPRKS